jgi:glycerol-3-phosphate acyltransferase PlsY
MPVGLGLAAGAYLLGSVSFAIVVAARHGVDPRTAGSGNPGATNVGRLLGKRVGRTVLVLDLLKGAVPTLAATLLLGRTDPWTAATGVAAVLGHCLPAWHELRGGKGAATAAGVMLVVVPPAGIVAAATYVGLKKLTRRASVGSLGGALAGAGVVAAIEGPTPPTWMAAAVLLLVVLRHLDNIGRLLRGEEPES